jgi:PPOX class probable F420-dependent enzyme
MAEMTTAQYFAFLIEGTRTAKVATVRPDGRPHVVPVWFVLDGDDILFSTAAGSVKGRNLRRDGRVSLCVDDERPPYAFVRVDGVAKISDDPAEVRRVSDRTALRYMGPERAAEYGELNAGPGMIALRVTPEVIVSEADVTG